MSQRGTAHRSAGPTVTEHTPELEIGDSETDSEVRQFAAEHQYVGALLYLSAERARPLLELVPDSAISRPVTRWAYELIRVLVGQHRAPDPVSVLAVGRYVPATQALNPHQPPAGRQLHELAMYLADAYTESIGAAFADRFARQILDDAYRRGFAALGLRMQQLAESGAERPDLAEQFCAIQDQLIDLWQRAETAAALPVGG